MYTMAIIYNLAHPYPSAPTSVYEGMIRRASFLPGDVLVGVLHTPVNLSLGLVEEMINVGLGDLLYFLLAREM